MMKMDVMIRATLKRGLTLGKRQARVSIVGTREGIGLLFRGTVPKLTVLIYSSSVSLSILFTHKTMRMRQRGVYACGKFTDARTLEFDSSAKHH